MVLSGKAKQLYERISEETTLGQLRAIAKEVKKDHATAMQLWSTGELLPRQLSLLIMDPKQLSQEAIDQLDREMQQHPLEERLQLMDWLLANQLAKDKKTIALMQSWRTSRSVLQRRTFWYYQARLRWVGQPPPPNTEILLDYIERDIMSEPPEVQWAMNFTAGQIGVYEPAFRSRCIALGERTGLYKDEVVARNCTPSYLPAFIEIQVRKLR